MSNQEVLVDATTTQENSALTAPERILERAIQVIEELGEVGIRTNPIAAECGVTPPILYRTFKSREGLVIAAQSERYRRATELAARLLCQRIASATTRDELVKNMSDALDYIFTDERNAARMLRVEVIGSAVSRPDLRQKIVEIDRSYTQQFVDAFANAREQGWINPKLNVEAVTYWGLSLVNARVSVEFDDRPEVKDAWNQFSKKAIINAVFGD